MTTQDERLGQVTEVPEGVRLRFTRSWPDPVQDVWSALTDNDRSARWIGTYEGGRGAGATGTFTMLHEAGPAAEAVTIAECDPPRRLVLEWHSEEAWRVELDLAERDGGTELTFTQVFPAGTEVADFALGWHWYLDKLGAEVSGGAGPGSWEEFLAARGPAYGS
jgi:uncharacterized protein YndB with AHSA1/START domain